MQPQEARARDAVAAPVRSLRPGCLKILLAALGVGFALLFGEIVSRLLPGTAQPGFPFHRCDRELGWRGIASDVFDLDFPDGEVRIVRNSRGMHDGEHGAKHAGSPFRVMYLGDSFVESLQVAERHTHHQLLEDGFDGRLEVINSGIGGWSLAQEILYFEGEGSAYSPDLVVLFWFVGNDLSDILPAARYQTCRGEDCYSPYFVLREETLERWSAARGAPVGWPDRYRFGRRLAAEWMHRAQSVSKLATRLATVLPKRDAPTGLTPDAPWQREGVPALAGAWRLTRALLSRLKSDVEAVGGRLAIVVVPFNRAVAADLAQAEWTQADGGPPLSSSDVRRPNERMLALAARLDLPAFDLHGAFSDAIRRGGPPPFWPDSHWTRKGNRIAASATESWLLQSGLVPPR